VTSLEMLWSARNTLGSFGQGSLRLHRALDGIHSYAASMLPNEPVEDCAPFGQPLERADLISGHERAVAVDICCEDCDEAPADCHRV
jgi:hypothetical protein